VRIAHGVGNKKRIEIVTEATKLKMKILNPGKVESMKKVSKKVEKPKKELTAKKESPETAATETKVEKPKKESKTTTAKGKNTGKKGTK
ncbi:MAG TPA: hypothetical protein VD694_07920, partial [Nitrososphaeraceae archaeon]|nr:hypothetical protein [Nitrososphaeraceae archaeon]